MDETLVIKFGGAAVASIEQFSLIADLILTKQKISPRIVIVVSAMGGTTNQLIDLAKQVNPQPPQREYDMLISVGERISMSLLAMALWYKGAEAMSFTGSQSGIITSARHTEAQVIDVKPKRLMDCLEQGKIAIVAGFQGVSVNKDVTTLGRGGSDISAVALALALGAQLEFFKDVPGVFSEDPKKNAQAVFYEHLTYDQALEIINQGAKILHPRALLLAAKNALPLRVKSFINFDRHEGTLISDSPESTRLSFLSSNPCYEGEECVCSL